MLKNTKRNAIAIAVCAACGVAASAQADTSVEIYGKLYPEMNKVWLSGGTTKGTSVSTLTATPAASTPDVSQLSMEAPNSRLGFRGVERLGGNLKAFFQLEMGFGIDTGEMNTPGQLFSRDTFVGLGGDFGTVRLGNMDTVYKTLGDTMSFLGISSGNFMSTSNILSKPGIGTSSASSFHLRRTNSVIYESPEFSGFQALFDYSLGEVPGDSKKGSVYSTGIKYEAGPLYAAIAYERHNDLFGGSKNVASALRNDSNPLANSRDSAVRLTAQYKLGKATRAEVNLAQLKYNETGGAVGKFSEYKHKAWSFSLEHKIEAVTLVGSYGQGDAGSCTLVGNVACNTDGLKGEMLNLGAGYSLSKRTLLFAVASYMGNDKSATYNNYLSGKPAPGQDIKTMSLGISHSF
jgi:predicted porin